MTEPTDSDREVARETETWRPVPGTLGLYEASTEGRIRRQPGTTSSGNRWKGGIIKPIVDRHGYKNISVSVNGVIKRLRVHVVICETFHGARPPGYDAAHENGAKSDCRAANLSWKTHRDNHLDKWRHGTAPIGSRHGMAILSESDVLQILSRIRSGEKNAEIAADYGMCAGTVKSIRGGVTWKHVIR